MNGYAGWDSGYELIPDTFWVWGRHVADALTRGNRFGNRALIGGNCWLNTWRTAPRPGGFEDAIDRATALCADRSCVVLFTVQQGVDLQPVWNAILRSPRDWLWLIRVHRKMASESFTTSIKQKLRPARAAVLIDEPSTAPLYALLCAVDVHVTSFSTCAIEAMAFGKPTVAFGPNARTAFGQLLDSRAMRHARDDASIVEGVAGFGSFNGDDAVKLADPFYESAESTASAIAAVQQQMRS
jgi:hypothetical protein